MKNYLPCCLCLASALLGAAITSAENAPAGEWGPATNNVQMSINLSLQPESGTTNDLRLVIRIRNTSTNQTVGMFVPDSGDRSEASFTVNFPSGRSALLTRPAQDSGHLLRIGPSQTQELAFDLRKLDDFIESGLYVIRAQHRILLGSNAFVVSSNPLKFTR
jgi:hypothetical protein